MVKRNKKVLLYLLTGIVAVIVLLFVRAFLTSGYVAVNLGNPRGELVATFTHTGTGETAVRAFDGSSLRERLSSGEYEVYLHSSEGYNYFEVISVGRFFSTTRVEAEPTLEAARQFVGSNPHPCMDYTNNKLFSFSCSGSLEGVQQHQPATTNVPTLTSSVSLPDDLVEGFVRTNNHRFFVVRLRFGEGHAALQVNKNYNLVNSFDLAQLNQQAYYNVAEYNDGFVAYNNDRDEFFQFDTPSFEGRSLTPPSPETEGFERIGAGFNTWGSTFTFSELSEDERNLDDHEAPQRPSEVVVQSRSSDSPSSYTFDTTPSEAVLCEEEYLCLLTNSTLEVYALEDDRAHYQYSITGVSELVANSGATYITKDSAVLKMNHQEQQGTVLYSYGDYEGCGFSVNPSGLLVCIQDTKGKNALLVSTTAAASGSVNQIDKAVLQLKENRYVENVSIYKKQVFISLKLGETVFQPELGGYGYSQEKIDTAEAVVEETLQATAIDRSDYTVRYTH